LKNNDNLPVILFQLSQKIKIRYEFCENFRNKPTGLFPNKDGNIRFEVLIEKNSNESLSKETISKT